VLSSSIEITGRTIGLGHAPYVVAELSGNHMGEIERAFRLIDAAAVAGAHAVKLQTYTPDTMTIDVDGGDFLIPGGLWHGRTLYDLYREAHTPWEWHAPLFAHARKSGLTPFSTPFDETAIALLESLDAPAYKIASFELVDIPLIRAVAGTGKPCLMSTGMANMAEISDAVDAFHSAGGGELILLHCVSGYPTPPEQANLHRIPELARRFGCLIGLSDHTLGTEVAIASVALGVCLIEKHFTLRRADGGVDSAFSLEPAEFAQLASGARTAFGALGSGKDEIADAERPSLIFRRSIYVVRDIAEGEAFTSENLKIIRPGYGLAPKEFEKLVGRRAARNVARGTRMSWDLVS